MVFFLDVLLLLLLSSRDMGNIVTLGKLLTRQMKWW